MSNRQVPNSAILSPEELKAVQVFCSDAQVHGMPGVGEGGFGTPRPSGSSSSIPVLQHSLRENSVSPRPLQIQPPVTPPVIQEVQQPISPAEIEDPSVDLEVYNNSTIIVDDEPTETLDNTNTQFNTPTETLHNTTAQHNPPAEPPAKRRRTRHEAFLEGASSLVASIDRTAV